MKKILSAILIVFCYYSAYNQQFFAEQQMISTTGISRAGNLYPADLDGDGDLDMLTTNHGDESIAWLKNTDGSGNFSSVMFLDDDVPQPVGAIAADLDGDGDPDIIYASWEKDEIMWKQNLDNTDDFGAAQLIDDYASGVWKLYAGDLDGDGDNDLIIPLREGKAIVWYENLDGKGSFSGKKYIDSDMENVREAFPADIDGDGFIDIVSLDWLTGSAMWYRNLEGKGNFSERIMITDQLVYPDKLICADLDGDGFKDIVVISFDDLVWLKNKGNQGMFHPPAPLVNEVIYDFFIADLNMDAHPDLLVSHSYFGRLGWYQNNGTGNFSALKQIPLNKDGYNVVSAADVDGDGDSDIFGSSAFNSTLILIKNLGGAGTFDSESILSKSDVNGPSDIFITHSGENEQNNIFVAAKNEGEVYIYESNQRNSGYDPVRKIAEISTPVSIYMKDMNGDNKDDLLACSEETGQLNWYQQTGQNNFGAAMNIGNIGSGASCIYSMDIENDGDFDIFASNQWTNKVYWFENNGSGIFGAAKMVGEGLDGATDIHSGDMDGDGDEDLLVASKFSRVSYFINNGNKTFTPEIIIETGMNGVEKIWALDMDNDGDLDILTHGYDKIIWYENLSNSGIRSARHVVNDQFYLFNIEYLFPFDADLDGYMDVFTAWGGSKKINWFRQDPDNKQFSAHEIGSYRVNGPVLLNGTDVDGDGKTDLVSASFMDNKIAWYKNEAVPDFNPQPDDAQICQSGNTSFTAMIEDASTYKWQMSPDLGRSFVDIEEGEHFTGVNTSTLQVYVPDPSFDEAQFRCVALFKGMEFNSIPAMLTVDRLILAEAGDDQITCNDFTYLNGSWPAEGSGQWTIVQGNGTFTDPNASFTRIEQLSTGENIFEWTIVNGICSSTDQVFINVKDSAIIVDQSISVEAIVGTNANLMIQASGDDLAYLWYKEGTALADDGRIEGSQSNQLTIKNVSISDQGSYQCRVNGFCNAAYSEYIPLNVITATDDMEKYSLKAYPNPVVNQLYIKSDHPFSKVFIYGSTGEKLYNSTSKTNINQLDFSGFSSGVYLVSILVEDHWHYLRIIKI